MSNNIVIIPARGNSKRLPNKNIKLLGGIPLLVHSINYAKNNGIQKIVVSTDSDLIKEISLKENVTVIDRPLELAGDDCSTVSALKHVLNSLEEKFDNVILLQATNPLRPQSLLKDAIKNFEEGNFDSLVTVSSLNKKFGVINNGNFQPKNYKFGQRFQDMEQLYFENGLLYISKSDLIKEGKIIGENNYPFIVNHPFSEVDVDTQEDFEYAEYLFKKSNK